MFTFSRIERQWHQLCMEFNALLWEDCLDEEMRMKIYLKIVYHKDKLAASAIS